MKVTFELPEGTEAMWILYAMQEKDGGIRMVSNMVENMGGTNAHKIVDIRPKED